MAIHALGYSHTEFLPSKPGRLCRGRERWIEPFEIDDEPGMVHRLVISGAAFDDDSAKDHCAAFLSPRPLLRH